MLELERIEDIKSFESLRPEWIELLESSSSDCLFLTWEWLFTWWKHLADGRRLYLLLVRRDRKLVAIAPFAIRPRQPGRLLPFRVLEFIGMGTVGSDYLDLIIRQGEEGEALDAFSKYLSSHKLVIELSRVKVSSRLVGKLASQLQNNGWRTSQHVTDICPYIDLSNHSWETYLAAIGSSHRHNIRRRSKALAQTFKLEFTIAKTEEQLRSCFKNFVELHHKRWDTRNGSAALNSPGLLRFHHEWSGIALQLDWLRLFVLSLDGKAVAAVYAFSYHGVFYFYQAGFDPTFSNYSVGLVAIGMTIKSAIAEGAHEYDLLHGDEKYKSLWAHTGRDLVRLNCYPPTTNGVLYRQAMELRNSIKKVIRWPLQLLSD
jgi:CelD/BcsL family acetyltransferase involved in cellulose biosynthesis